MDNLNIKNMIRPSSNDNLLNIGYLPGLIRAYWSQTLHRCILGNGFE